MNHFLLVIFLQYLTKVRRFFVTNCECQMPDAWSIDYVSSHWRKLEDQSLGHCVFQSWAWLDCWLGVAKKHIRPIIFKDNGKVVGMCFIGFGKTYDAKIIGFKTIFPFLSGMNNVDIITPEYNQILCLDEYKHIVYKLLIEFIANDKRLKKYSRILLSHISQEHLEEYQKTAQDTGYHLDIYKTVHSAYVDLKKIRDENLDYNHSFSKSLKTDIRRCEKLYTEKYGILKLEKPGNVTQAQNWFQELGKLNKVRFQKKNQKSAWDYPELVGMHRAFLNRQFSSGTAQIVRLCAGTTPIGYLYNFMYRNVVYFYMSGFRLESDNRLKPGLLTHSHAIQDYFKQGLKTYDFMAGDQSYKYRMATDTNDVFYLTLTKKTMSFKCVQFLKKLTRFLKSTKKDTAPQETLPHDNTESKDIG